MLLLAGLLVAVLVAWRLHHCGCPPLRWLPLAFLAFLGVMLLWVVSWFVRRKLTYPRMARANKADLKAGGDGWPRERPGRGGMEA